MLQRRGWVRKEEKEDCDGGVEDKEGRDDDGER